ncbi:LysM peptidoglycan-binding domain-containing protein [Mucilaginibacter sp. CSA2-8R]|uniref:DPBB and LysM peptidoglycan-binding domain-containing protein n=1 Tax=Mucilaginibacter sp. CSA2-8R TaxID=3141542 RepID=UPI00315DC20C
MKFKIFLLAGLSSLCSLPVLASTVLDSIGIENLDGKKVILHKLDPRDNYFSIGRRYNVKPNVIIQFNNNASMRVGNVIKVPTEQPFLSPTPQSAAVATSNNSTDGTTVYKVSAGETLYAISRRFNMKVEDIISLNNLKSTNLTPGQLLNIKAAATTPPVAQPQVTTVQTTVTTQPATTAQTQTAAQQQTKVQQTTITTPVIIPPDSTRVAAADSTGIERRVPANRYGITERNEKGVATYMDDSGLGLDPNKKLALHRTAPVGTVIKITNPMTNRTTFAKVVGRFNDNESTKDVMVVLTKSAADALGALDKRFHVNISYGTPNESQE